jgi:biopolymer transport protein ExbB
METTKKTQVVGIKNAGIVIICCLVIAVCIFQFLLGNPSNFMNNDPNNHPLNMLGTIYKGGIIVPIIQTLLLTVLALSIERYFALRSAFGKGSLSKFVANIKDALAAGDMKKAQEICDKQRLDNRYDDTTFVNSTQHVQRVIVRVIVHKVGRVT